MVAMFWKSTTTESVRPLLPPSWEMQGVAIFTKDYNRFFFTRPEFARDDLHAQPHCTFEIALYIFVSTYCGIFYRTTYPRWWESSGFEIDSSHKRFSLKSTLYFFRAFFSQVFYISSTKIFAIEASSAMRIATSFNRKWSWLRSATQTSVNQPAPMRNELVLLQYATNWFCSNAQRIGSPSQLWIQLIQQHTYSCS